MNCPYITKSGDKGKTSIMNKRLAKYSPLICFIGALDEINSNIGLILSHINEKNFSDLNLTKLLLNIQNQLLNIGGYMSGGNITIDEKYHLYIEEQSNLFFKNLKNANNFVFPGGSMLSSYIHITRCIIRRSETIFWQYINQANSESESQPESQHVGQYINRLSDLFFVLGRLHGQKNELLWKVGEFLYEQ
ncbi:cob(I)yrinic acid a,c-diamide adenosyltransferase [Candidatus Cytomitobacter indipagum]|uniref:Corrinoid adenosyltransferase n=1 Tax=Candidatus Cytomitobacter indipagum TaxID=2601575 RepID=A0A5C0UDJ3_9PROT|nr:cob(I)yrinic acid a,c-diamide adenosyltransferase [Candidatus Cytomitobacter indipagum]QEK38058.1 cob(I)yrinic acid a,c-diamide adenosyltransferase [Candidatus Cytomitobacter indipagum]